LSKLVEYVSEDENALESQRQTGCDCPRREWCQTKNPQLTLCIGNFREALLRSAPEVIVIRHARIYRRGCRTSMPVVFGKEIVFSLCTTPHTLGVGAKGRDPVILLCLPMIHWCGSARNRCPAKAMAGCRNDDGCRGMNLLSLKTAFLRWARKYVELEKLR